MNVVSLFANIGIEEAYLKSLGFNVAVANELEPRRVEIYRQIYPNTEMICGDITDKGVYSKIREACSKQKIDVIMASPPCQGMSTAGKQTEFDTRNELFLYAVNDTSSEMDQPDLFSALESSENGDTPGGRSSTMTSSISVNVTSHRRNRSTQILHEKILHFCKDYKSLAEISEHVNRSIAHLKTHVIPGLLETGRLQRKYPGTPNHPDQKYKTEQ